MLSQWVILGRLVLAAILSGFVGFEREFHGRAAGFRTHILVCVGSTLIMLTSIHIFNVYAGLVACDPARLAAGVITGIGFLGAGTIIHSKASVRGLTTAASLWVVTGIGLAVGSGLYFGAIATTFLAIVALMFFSRFEYFMIRRDWYKTLHIEMQENVAQLQTVREHLADYGAEIRDFGIERTAAGGVVIVRIGLKLSAPRSSENLLHDIGRIDGVKHVSWDIE